METGSPWSPTSLTHRSSLPQASPKFFEDLKEKFDQRNNVINLLGVTQKCETSVQTEKAMVDHRNQYQDAIALWGYKLSAGLHSDRNKNIKISVQPKFVLAGVFKLLYDEWRMTKLDSSLLFCDVTEENAGKFLVPWTIRFEGLFVVAKMLSP